MLKILGPKYLKSARSNLKHEKSGGFFFWKCRGLWAELCLKVHSPSFAHKPRGSKMCWFCARSLARSRTPALGQARHTRVSCLLLPFWVRKWLGSSAVESDHALKWDRSWEVPSQVRVPARASSFCYFTLFLVLFLFFFCLLRPFSLVFAFCVWRVSCCCLLLLLFLFARFVAVVGGSGFGFFGGYMLLCLFCCYVCCFHVAVVRLFCLLPSVCL